MTEQKTTSEATAVSWEKLPGEPKVAYQAFNDYRNLGRKRGYSSLLRLYKERLAAHHRSVEAGGDLMPKPPAMTVRTIERWASRFKWVERVEAWDADQDRIAADQLEEERKAMRARERALGLKLMERAEQMVGFPITEVQDVDASGRVVIVRPNGWGVRDVPGVAYAASEMFRLGADMPLRRGAMGVDVAVKQGDGEGNDSSGGKVGFTEIVVSLHPDGLPEGYKPTSSPA